jgi:hypothetical protein
MCRQVGITLGAYGMMKKHDRQAVAATIKEAQNDMGDVASAARATRRKIAYGLLDRWLPIEGYTSEEFLSDCGFAS